MALFSDGLEELTNKISSLTFNVIEIADLFSTTAYYSPLLKSQDAARVPIDIDRRERTFSSDNPVFLRRVEFSGANAKNLELAVFTSEGIFKKIPVTEQTKGGYALVNEFCIKFTLRSKGAFAKPKLSGIKIFGYDFKLQQKTRSALSEFVSVHYDLTSFLAEVKKTVAADELSRLNSAVALKSTQEKLEAAEEDLAAIEESLIEKNTELVDISNRIKANSAIAVSINAEIEAKSNNVQQLERESKRLNVDVADLHLQLSSLVNDRSVISDEFSDFVKEGKSQAKVYVWLMVLPVLVMGASVGILFNGANNLVIGHYETSQDIIASILLRIPFAAAVGGAIYYSWVIGSSFMKKIFEIQEERLTLAKLLVLAKNTVFSTAEDLGIDAKEKFHLRTRLKIEMLKSHLAKNLGGNMNLPELDSSSGGNAENNDPPSASSKEKPSAV
jgi:hypothetical protein